MIRSFCRSVLCSAAVLAVLPVSTLAFDDCNGNGIPDETDTEVQFETHLISTLALGAQTVFAADLDGDGDVDALSASLFDNKVVWYRNLDGAGTFGAGRTISDTAMFARSVLATDIDGDGDPDVLSASATDNKIAWYANDDGAGGFGPEQVITTLADGAWSVAAADLDGDGDVDALSASLNDNKIAWYENTDGAGGFGPQQVISLAANFVLSVAAADVDGDGDVDVLSASATDNKIAWYENTDGAGGFGPQQIISTEADDAWSVHAADVDGDGDIDVLSASPLDDKVAWYEKLDGLDGFGPQQVISTDTEFAKSVYAADVDSDGDLDVLSASEWDDEISWFENVDGTGSFGPQRIISAAADAARSVFALDLDGDGDTDVLSASMDDNTVAWYENTSEDCNANRIPDECEPDCNMNGVADGCDLDAQTSNDCNANLVPDECDIATGGSDDCAGEGVPDECEPDCNGNQEADSCDILLGGSADCTGDGIPDECEPDCNGNQEADSCDILLGGSADCTGDGVPDECEPDCNGNQEADSCDLDLGTSDDCDGNTVPDDCDIAAGADDCDSNGIPDACETEISFVAQLVSTDADFPRSVFAADIDGDGDADILSASFSDDKVAWYENSDGAGAFGAQQTISTAADGALSVFAADLDGDGDTDVLSASFSDDEIAWYENENGLGLFGEQQVITTAADGAQSVFAADMDGDGDIDALSASFLDSTIAWYENTDGVGGFGPRRIVSTEAGSGFAVFAADLDGDEDIDVLSASQADDKIAWYENTDGSGNFGPQLVITTAADGAQSVFALDLDGDGDTDVLSASQGDDKIAWYENTDGLGAFGPAILVSSAANGASSVYAADVDGDGDADVVSASFFDGKVAWYENTDGAGTFGAQQVVATSPGGTYAVFATDLDGDGDTDLISTAQNDDRIVWYENESGDCNGNGVPDACDAAVIDCTGNDIPDECEPDCNGNDEADSCDIGGGSSLDCNINGVPDECEPDCNANGIPDTCDVGGGGSDDCNGNLFPDECEPDCNADGVPDACDPDCNANGIPDGCEADCNGNGVPDACDLSGGFSIDCNANDVPDECDTDCVGSCDADGDNCVDELDSDPGNRFICADTDRDGCDDCRGGSFDPADDGPDFDMDGACNVGDCDPGDGTVWLEPEAITTLALFHAGGFTTLTWQPPADIGADFAAYDTLRSPDASDFVSQAVCLETDDVDTLSADFDAIDPGVLFCYLIRVENECPGGVGAMGSDSEGVPRAGVSCP